MTTPPRASYRKQCECRTTATRGALRIDQRPTPDGKGVRFQVSLPPGPVCDGCGVAWRLVK